MQAETDYDLRENIAALYIAVLREDAVTPEQAFAILEDAIYKITDEDVKDMMKLHECGMVYRDIAKLYGISYSLVAKKIRAYKKETNLDGSPKRSAI